MTYWYPLSMPTIGEEEIDAAVAVLRSGRTTMGEKVEQFEEAFADYVGADHAIMVNSGSSADLLMAFAGTPCEILIPAVTWPTHVWSYVMAGYHVRFVDVDGVNTTPALVAAGVRSRTLMVSIPHLMGIPAPIPDLGLAVTEDCCEALGASPIAENLASWSFFFSHQMTTMEGGMVTTDSPSLARELRSMRSHGWSRAQDNDQFKFIRQGFNIRPTEVAAAIGLVQLDRLPHFNKIRDENHRLFVDALEGCVELPPVPEGVTPSWFGFPFFTEDRDGLAEFLAYNGVETRPILGGNLMRQPAFKEYFPAQELPGADRVHDHGLYVGLHPVANSGVEEVAELIKGFVS